MQRAQSAARGWMALLWTSVLLLCAGHAFAQRTEGDRAAAQGAYATEVPVRNQTAGERDKAYARALAQVLVNVTGDRGAGSRPGVRDELRRADDYVAGYDYRQDEGLSASGAPSFQTTLVVRFKQREVDDLVQVLGLPYWPMPRPKPVLWLAIDDGSGPRLVGLPQRNAARSLLDQAKSRGFALGLPTGSAAEQAAAGAIWRGDTAAIASLSKRYAPPMQLLGKLQRGAGGWVADWIFVDQGKVLSKWQTTHADARRAMAGGADGTADALFKRYAKAGSGGPAGRYRIRVLGVRSTGDYLRLMGYLDGVSIVKRIQPASARPDVLELDLELSTGVANFARVVGRAGVLTAAAGDDEDAGEGGAGGRVTTFRLGG